MLSIYSFQRKTVLVGTMILASVAVAMMAQSVHARTIASVRRAIVSNGAGSKVFSIDTTGRMATSSNYVLEITTLNDDGTLVGKYYSPGKLPPASTNVAGSISIVRGIRITFTVTERAGLGVNETVFEGAIRLGTRDVPFMAGTFTNTVSGGAPAGFGPLPFCAKLTSIP